MFATAAVPFAYDVVLPAAGAPLAAASPIVGTGFEVLPQAGGVARARLYGDKIDTGGEAKGNEALELEPACPPL